MSKKKKNLYTAIVGTEYRNVYTLSPIVCIRNIVNVATGEVFRDHAWIPLTDDIRAMVKDNKKYAVITFKAREQPYQTRGPAKIGLVGVTEVTKVMTVKK